MLIGISIVIGILLIMTIKSVVVIVPEGYAYLIEWLGSYQTTWEKGLHIKIPVFQRISKQVNLKEQVLDYPPQPAITKDNVTIQIDTVVYFTIFDPKLYTYGVDNAMLSMEILASTTLRSVIGSLELDQTLTSRDVINAQMQNALDAATDPWGIRVKRVELKSITPPRDIQDAMEKQMRAEREKRESVLKAEGERQASILLAEGEKQSAILKAEAAKIAMVKEAEGHAESIKLHKMAEADGIQRVKQAEASATVMLIKAGLSPEQVVQLQGFAALTQAADGQATKIIIPSDMQNMGKTLSAAKELLNN